MQMLTALFGSLKGVFSKTYLLTGLLPAAAILLSWDWYVEGGTIGTLMSKDKSAVADAAALSTRLIGLGLIFYAVHQPLLRFFETIPGKPFGRLRQYMVHRQAQAQQKARLEYETRNWEYTAVKWPERGFQSEGNYVPEWSQVPELAVGLEKSKAARDKLVAATKARFGGAALPQPQDIDIIVEGLCRLMEISRRDPASNDYQEERQAWTKLINDTQGAKEVLRHVEDHVFRRSAEAQQELASYPESERWIKPTALGNRIAALDDYAERRYGIVTSTLWARLWSIVEDEDRQGVTDAQLMVHMLLNLCVASLMAVVVVVIDSLRSTWHVISTTTGSLQSNWRVMIFIAVAISLTWVFYSSAVAAFRSVREHVIRLVDLKRGVLIEKLGFKVPDSAEQEKQFFKDLNSFFTYGGGSMQNWPRHDTPTAPPITSTFPSVLEQKLNSISVQEVMICKDQIVPETLAKVPPNRLCLAEIIESLSQAKLSALPVLNDKAQLMYVIPKGELDRYLAQKSSIGVMTVDEINKLRLADLFSESPSLKSFFQSNFATVAKEASITDAQKAMDEMPDCLDIFVTEDGKKASQVVGWVTNVQIAIASRQ